MKLGGVFMRVYEKVRDYLENHGLKQKAVARKAGIPDTTFNAILNGKRTLYADDLQMCIRDRVYDMFLLSFRKKSVPVEGSILVLPDWLSHEIPPFFAGETDIEATEYLSLIHI